MGAMSKQTTYKSSIQSELGVLLYEIMSDLLALALP